ncbi:putative hydrolase [Enhygromyxa salina]|uniref:Putative hydrolase n=1 Tax=Enhygromyxa salina TaxID=215803 RepID=A0A2S9XIZ4_9BACT|nr:alpha/beta fold hydrolase [Enhygromyxa salina]PRP92651.1 putative hydrolase [Enhygromyxa salina]
MHRLITGLGLCLAIVACEARTPEPKVEQPAEQSPPAARSPQPAGASAAEPAVDDELPQVAGIHYLELVTAGADPEAELPMIVALHGLGDTPEGFRGLLAGFDRPVRVILPRALDPHEPGWSWFPLRAADEDIEQLAQGIADAARRLAPAIARLSVDRPTTGKPIVVGFSQGGMLSFTLAVHHPELFSAAFPVGGWLPEPLWPSAKVDAGAAPPIVAFHGDADRAVRYEPTKAAVEQLEQAGYRVELRTYEGVGHAIPQPMHADLMSALRAALDRSE